MKKLLAMMLVLTMAVSMAACGSKSEEPTEAPSETQEEASGEEAGTEAPTDGAEYVVGICQLVQHDALDAATQGFKDALTEEFGDKISFDEQNASGDVPTCSR